MGGGRWGQGEERKEPLAANHGPMMMLVASPTHPLPSCSPQQMSFLSSSRILKRLSNSSDFPRSTKKRYYKKSSTIRRR